MQRWVWQQLHSNDECVIKRGWLVNKKPALNHVSVASIFGTKNSDCLIKFFKNILIPDGYKLSILFACIFNVYNMPS
jgi:hypothetical protein